MKEQDKTPEEQLSKVKIGNLPEKEFRVMIMNMIQVIGKRMEAQIEMMQEMFNNDLEELKNRQVELNNTITEMKNILEEINSRVMETEERISELEDRMVEIISMEQNKGKRILKKMRTVSETCGTILYAPTFALYALQNFQKEKRERT